MSVYSGVYPVRLPWLQQLLGPDNWMDMETHGDFRVVRDILSVSPLPYSYFHVLFTSKPQSCGDIGSCIYSYLACYVFFSLRILT